jgi:hypothetical protein
VADTFRTPYGERNTVFASIENCHRRTSKPPEGRITFPFMGAFILFSFFVLFSLPFSLFDHCGSWVGHWISINLGYGGKYGIDGERFILVYVVYNGS